jgi:hypothetical protein
MDANDVQEWIEAYAVDMGNGEWDMTDGMISAVSREIAKDCMDTQWTAFRSYTEAISKAYLQRTAQYEARLAVIRQAADAYIKQVLSGMSVACIATEKAEKALQEALSTTPEILWQADAKYRITEWGTPEVNVPTDDGMEIHTALRIRDLDRVKGRKAKVIIIADEEGTNLSNL